MDNNTPAEQNMRLTVPFFGVTDMEASLRFYVDGLGFKITNQWMPRGKIEWCWLERDRISIMLQQPDNQDNDLYTLPDKKGFGINTCIQWQDALALYHEFKERELEPNEPFVGNGMWVFGIHDPDGYHLEFES